MRASRAPWRTRKHRTPFLYERALNPKDLSCCYHLSLGDKSTRSLKSEAHTPCDMFGFVMTHFTTWALTLTTSLAHRNV